MTLPTMTLKINRNSREILFHANNARESKMNEKNELSSLIFDNV